MTASDKRALPGLCGKLLNKSVEAGRIGINDTNKIRIQVVMKLDDVNL